MKTNLTVSEILDWQSRAVIEATLEVIGYGKNPKVVVTEKLINKHKAQAERQLNELIREARIDELKRLKLSGTPDKMYDILVEVPELTTKNDVGLLSIEDRIAHLKETEVKDE